MRRLRAGYLNMIAGQRLDRLGASAAPIRRFPARRSFLPRRVREGSNGKH
jgi:hypothetical protein